MITTAPTRTRPTFRVLARKEIGAYARSKLFLIASTALVALTVTSFISDDGTSSTMAMISPAALLGVVGMFVMAGLVARSDAAADAAGTVIVSESTRTLALASAIVVPAALGLAWFASAVVMLYVIPPEPWAVPFGPVSSVDVLTVIFALSVGAAVGGPMLGLVLMRLWPRRATVAISAVVMVLVTIVLQGNFESTWRWHVVWPWTYWYGPVGWSDAGTAGRHWVALPGSPYAWTVYVFALSALGLLVAMHHDPEADRRRLRLPLLIVGGIAAMALVLTFVLGPSEAVINPLMGTSY